MANATVLRINLPLFYSSLYHLLKKNENLLIVNISYERRDHQNMGRRYIEVFQGKRSDYYAAIALVRVSFG